MVFVDWLTAYCLKKSFISIDDVEWFSYGIVRRLSLVFTITVLFPIGCYFTTIITMLSFTLSFFFLRKRTNGYHAKNFSSCLIFSVCSVIAIFGIIQPNLSDKVVLLVPAISNPIIFLLAPFDHPNSKMTKEERDISAKKAKRNTTGLSLILFFAHWLSCFDIAIGISLGIGYSTFLLILAHIICKGGQAKNE